MTTNDAESTVHPFPLPPTAPVASEATMSRPMPRLGRGIVWSDIVAEIDRDNDARMRDAA